MFWTESAERRMANFLEEHPKKWQLTGDAALEMAEDLRTHIHEELHKQGTKTVTLISLESVLHSLDGVSVAEEKERLRPAPDKMAQAKSGCLQIWSNILSFVACLIAPILAVILALSSDFVEGVIFNPMPTWWHALLLSATVFISSSFVIRRLQDKTCGAEPPFAVGFALAVTSYYAVAFLPITPFALFGMIFIIGFVPLAPFSLTVWLLRFWFVLKRNIRATEPERLTTARKRFWLGMGLGVLILGLLEVPSYITQYGLKLTRDPKTRDEGVAFLQKYVSQTRLQICCSQAHSKDAAEWLLTTSFIGEGRGFNRFDRIDGIEPAEIFYRVTGIPLNQAPDLGWDFWAHRKALEFRNAVSWDAFRGGKVVGSQLEGLSLAESRMDGHVDAASQLAYLEWTCTMLNESFIDQEARCIVQLPSGGVVSRLTLWINDEPQEAAFSSVAKVTKAYQEVAVVQRRDPVLVRNAGPDRVFVQCFPVPRQGGRLKFRLGITAPVQAGAVQTPFILNKNFLLASGLHNESWWQGNTPITSENPVETSAEMKGMQAINQTWPRESLGKPLTFHLSQAAAAKVWTEDSFAAPEQKYLVRTLENVTQPAAGHPIVVLDGSSTVQPWAKELANSLGETEIVFAGPTPRTTKLKELKATDFVGGNDNTDALAAALKQAQSHPGSVIVWLHGPQPYAWKNQEKILQLVDHGRAAAFIYDVSLQPSENRLFTTLAPLGLLKPGPIAPSPAAFAAWLGELDKPHPANVPHYQRQATEPTDGVKVWDHLARYRIYEDLLSQTSPAAISEDKTALAAKYQLVTPWSGAVVLESKADYTRNQLQQADAKTTPSVPNVPEPSTLMVAIPILWLGLRRRRCRNMELAC